MWSRRHKKHRSKHRHKDSDSDSADSNDEEDLELIDDLLEKSLKPAASTTPRTETTTQARDVEILRASAGNGIVESMKIVVNNRNGSKEQVTTSVTC